MKKIYVSVAMLLTSIIGISQNLLNDNFSTYSPGTLSGQNGWTNNSSNPGGGGTCTGVLCTNNSVVAKAMSFPNFGSTTQAVSVAPNQDAVGKAFTSTNTGSVYGALLVNLSAAPSTAGDLVRFLAGGNFTTAMRIYVRSVAGGYNVGIAKEAQSAVFKATPTFIPYNTDHLLVIKYTYNTASSTDDVVTLYIDPNVSQTEASNTPEVSSSTGTDVSAGIDRVQFPFNNSTRPTGFIGGISISRSFDNSIVLPVNNVLDVQLSKRTANTGLFSYRLFNGRSISWLVLEASNDAVTFSSVVQQANNGDKSYSHNVNLQNGMNYFRLKIVGNDGVVRYSQTLAVKGGSTISTGIRVNPVPVTDYASVTVNSIRNETATLSIIDLFGRAIASRSIKLTEGENILPVDASALPKGNYLIKVVSASQGIQQVKFVKQ